MSSQKLREMLIKYVNNNSNVYNLEWDPKISQKLLFDPFSKSNSKEITHYFLLVAAITESKLIGRAENSRALMIHLHDKLKVELFKCQEAEQFRELIHSFIFYEELGPEKDVIPEVIASVNCFVDKVSKDDLILYSKMFNRPEEMVNDLSQYILRMDGLHVEKLWMYLQWMTRPHPDLEVFKHFSLQDLQVPLTSYIRDIAYCLSLCEEQDSKWWEIPGNNDKARESITRFARELFPEDPTRVDYPLYQLGRWIKGKKLEPQLIESYLMFFDKLYDKTHTVPVTYDIVSRSMSNFEEDVKAELRKIKMMFYFESLRFNLPGGITYLPDFVLPESKIKGKTVLLEPHGIWSYPKTRTFSIGGRVMSTSAYGVEPDQDESKFISKLRSFRESFGQDFYLILIVPAWVKDRVQIQYHESYDELYEGADIPELLFRLTRRR